MNTIYSDMKYKGLCKFEQNRFQVLRCPWAHTTTTNTTYTIQKEEFLLINDLFECKTLN